MGELKSYLQKLELVHEKHAEYKKEAYSFIMIALHHTLQKIGEQRHVTGQELSLGIKDYAIEQFGPLVKTVFEYWGIHETFDFGKIVYNLIEEGMMGKTDDDSIDDFRNVYDFNAVFAHPVDYDI